MVVIQEGQTVRLNKQTQKKQLPSQDGVLHCANTLLTGGQTQKQKGHKPPVHHSNSMQIMWMRFSKKIQILSFSEAHEFILWKTNGGVTQNVSVLNNFHCLFPCNKSEK